jgi:hypothetical protein
MSINYERLPENIRAGAERYLEHGIAPGDFLTAVICNDLSESFACADDTNLERMHDIVKFFYNEAPSGSWGSKKRMADWLSRFTNGPEALAARDKT